jgi:hypothetical protein
MHVARVADRPRSSESQHEAVRSVPPRTAKPAATQNRTIGRLPTTNLRPRRLPRSGRRVVRCPLPDHNEAYASCQVYAEAEHGSWCFGCAPVVDASTTWRHCCPAAHGGGSCAGTRFPRPGSWSRRRFGDVLASTRTARCGATFAVRGLDCGVTLLVHRSEGVADAHRSRTTTERSYYASARSKAVESAAGRRMEQSSWLRAGRLLLVGGSPRSIRARPRVHARGALPGAAVWSDTVSSWLRSGWTTRR